ncbi:hypothetical protein RI367_003283 [Sorochytrium milnesiophthora]
MLRKLACLKTSLVAKRRGGGPAAGAGAGAAHKPLHKQSTRPAAESNKPGAASAAASTRRQRAGAATGKHQFCVGVDFGTTYSGFAVAYTGAGERIPRTAAAASSSVSESGELPPITPVVPTVWYGFDKPEQPPNVTGVKVPTVLCYDKADATLDSWGYAAHKRNSPNLVKVERVKLCLEPSTPEYMRPLLPPELDPGTVIADYLRELNRCCLELIQRTWGVSTTTGDLGADDIMYCFTVPVDWSPESHRRLRRAAYQAGMIAVEQSGNLMFCYEPEAAALSCIHDPDVVMAPASSFLVVDCGGGTVDLFQCAMGATPTELSELTVGTGGFLGAVNVDVGFMHHLRDVFGSVGLDALSTSPRCATGWANLMSQWESRKRAFTGREKTVEELFVPQVLIKELRLVLDDDELPESVLETGTVTLTPQLMRAFFDPVIDAVLALVHIQLRKVQKQTAQAAPPTSPTSAKRPVSSSTVSSSATFVTASLPSKAPQQPAAKVTFSEDVQSIRSSALASGKLIQNLFVVGGFGSNEYLRRRIAADPLVVDLVHRVRTIPTPEIAVLKGAVYAGTFPGSIRSRRARKTIGVQILRPYNAAAAHDGHDDVVYTDPLHPQDTRHWLVDTYVEPFIHRGDVIDGRARHTKHHFALSPGTHTGDINIYASSSSSPSSARGSADGEGLLHIHRDACELLGTVSIHVSPDYRRPSAGSEFSISIDYGRVELEVSVTDMATQRVWRTILGHGNITVANDDDDDDDDNGDDGRKDSVVK